MAKEVKVTMDQLLKAMERLSFQDTHYKQPQFKPVFVDYIKGEPSYSEINYPVIVDSLKTLYRESKEEK